MYGKDEDVHGIPQNRLKVGEVILPPTEPMNQELRCARPYDEED